MATNRDRVTRVWVRGVRSLQDVSVDTDGLRVMIGENGVGKSTLLEVIELLRKLPTRGVSFGQIMAPHGLRSLLRAGSTEMELGARVEGGGPPLEYSLGLIDDGKGVAVGSEHLQVFDGTVPTDVVSRKGRERSFVATAGEGEPNVLALDLSPGALLISQPWPWHEPAVLRIADTLSRIRTHFVLDTQPLWLAREQQRRQPVREPAELVQASEVERFGANLASCYYGLRQAASWPTTLEKLRAGLGLDLVDVKLPPAQRGHVSLELQFGAFRDGIPAAALSDGQLAYLTFVALSELGREHSLLAVDEPETHLHPGLVVRVVDLMQELSESCPVLLATHSNALLDALPDPASSVILAELDEHRATCLRRIDASALPKWLEEYRGFGDLRSAGFERQVTRAAGE